MLKQYSIIIFVLSLLLGSGGILAHVQQGLLTVDKTWSEQDHIKENANARAALMALSDTSDNITDYLREGGEGFFGKKEYALFTTADNDDYENQYLNAGLDAFAEIYAATYGISIEAARVVAVNAHIGGAHIHENGTSRIYLNDHAQDNALDYANNLGHEVTHAQIAQDADRDRGDHDLNEAYAELRGGYAADLYAFSYSNNGLGDVKLGRTNAHVGNANNSQLKTNTRDYYTENAQGLEYNCQMMSPTGNCAYFAHDEAIRANLLTGNKARAEELIQIETIASFIQLGREEQLRQALAQASPQVIDEAVQLYKAIKQEDDASMVAGAGLLLFGTAVVAGPTIVAGGTTLLSETGAFISNPYTFCSINSHLCLAGAEAAAEIGTGSVLAASVVPNAGKKLLSKYADDVVDVLRGPGDEMLNIVNASRLAKADDAVSLLKQQKPVGRYEDVPYDDLTSGKKSLGSNTSTNSKAVQEANPTPNTYGGGRFVDQAEANEALKQYELAKNADSEIILGRLKDTEAGSQLGMTRLNSDNWTPSVNDAFVQGGIDAGKPFYLGSNPDISNYRAAWNTLEGNRGKHPSTVFFKEMKQLRDAGYRLEGDYMLPPK